MKKYQNFLSENFHFLVVKFSVYLNKLVFVMGIMVSNQKKKKKKEKKRGVGVGGWGGGGEGGK